ncbi:membrane protein [Pseudomonas veronii 1YdBTEX2]|uniref:TonB C-terminal domain-containing protein n=2 Tax=Pseudomonas veronii TaxID=76761 RepID=A0A7Y1FBC6_PSEVE|nr:TonB C-terminal domain-containing protein [Pseudomonas veronii]NMY12068.1 TonB C-terminal domain-containing protein [Pseudomonas veronii]SBW84110.1 membrane protein [Pseudomonas veronii 1YdBTEX2]
MRALIKNLSQEEGDASTVNIKRTTLVAGALCIIVVLMVLVVIAFYASFKAMSAANAVDDAWQSQRERILNIEAKSVQASSDAAEVKISQAAILRNQLNADKNIANLQQSIDQSQSYRAAKAALDAEQEAAVAKADAAHADAQKQVEEAEKKGVENFDKMLVARLQSRWMRPESATSPVSLEVLVQFAPDGTITNALVPTSSGSKDVDDSVIKAAADLAKIPEMATVNRAIYLKYLRQRTVKFESGV